MTAAEYLSRPAALRRAAARERNRVDTLRGLCTRLTSRLREIRVQASPDPARLQSLLAEIADGEAEIRRMEEALSRALEDTALYISSLPDERLIRVLELRYLEGLSWEDLSWQAGYSRACVFRYHRQALGLLPPPPAPPEEDPGPGEYPFLPPGGA